jgi:hypothetical protein
MEIPAWFDLGPGCGVLELDETVTSPGPALELHVVVSEQGARRLWSKDLALSLGSVEIGYT